MSEVEDLRNQIRELDEQISELAELEVDANTDEGREVIETRTELQNTRNELQEALDSMNSEPGASTSASAPIVLKPEDNPRGFRVGNYVTAKWSSDGQWYAANIVAIKPPEGEGEAWTYVVTFVGYGNRDVVTDPSIKEAVAPAPGESSNANEQNGGVESGFGSGSRGGDGIESGRGVVNRVAKKAKAKSERKKATEEALNAAQSSWLQFQAGGGKKKKKKGSKKGGKDALLDSLAANNSSMFRTPDSLDGKVGVVGSGKPVTAQPATVRYKAGYGGGQ